MNFDQIATIEHALAPLKHVTWDRFTADRDHWTIYGWIDRENDAYKDFIVVEFDFDEDMSGYGYSFVTSSTKYSEYFHEALEIDAEHSPCNRAEMVFHQLNTIKLNKTASNPIRDAQLAEHRMMQHQAFNNLKSAKAVGQWSELRVKDIMKGDES